MEDTQIEAIPELSEQEKTIIDFINEKQFELEAELHAKVAEATIAKYGDEGKKIIDSLNEDIMADGREDSGECEECGKVPEGWVEKSEGKLQLMEVFLDDTYEEVAQEIIEYADEGMISNTQITGIMEGAGLTATPELISNMKKKILFLGISEGWLIDEIFVGDE